MTSTTAPPCYLFGIVPADEAGALRVTTPDGCAVTDVRLLRRGELTAVVGSAPTDRPLGRAADLRAHDRVLADVVAAGVTVLPFRFGAVLPDGEADELLAERAEPFAAALGRVRGRVQYTVTARYEQDTVLREVLAAHPEIAALRSPDGEDDLGRQLQLGELVVRALEQLRPADAEALTAGLRPLAAEIVTFDPGAADAVLRLAALVERGRADRFEQAAEQCARSSAGRLRLRLVGPVAPYDFVAGA